MLDKKLQLKPGQTMTILGDAVDIDLDAQRAGAGTADAILVFATDESKLRAHLSDLQAAAQAGRLTWVAYPKSGQLNTNLNRNEIRAIANANGLDPVRQIAIDEVWSALRLKSAA